MVTPGGEEILHLAFGYLKTLCEQEKRIELEIQMLSLNNAEGRNNYLYHLYALGRDLEACESLPFHPEEEKEMLLKRLPRDQEDSYLDFEEAKAIPCLYPRDTHPCPSIDSIAINRTTKRGPKPTQRRRKPRPKGQR